ncbi:PspC domain-containing protein [Methylomonas sp. SURF-1]|uniref:PspC domain-containing protein n=1 Tax=Methylomonas aurea TaxID=2952224 RepID=A0ABT1UGX1_9GAMM|nr:PspC domain-containing protein [Methylomonas sp. SURF-1]MCQ8181472.1 PspC domain-containing protein [Methylomonas sp. SURF-1]
MPLFPEASATRKLERDLDRRRLGGVCSGLARYTGFSVSAVRFIFLGSVFFSFSLTFWLYLALWIVLPGRRSSVSELSWRLQRKARRLEKLIETTQARLRRPAVRSALERTHQLVLSLLPDFDGLSNRNRAELAAAKHAVLEQLPTMLEHYLRLSPSYPEQAGGAAAEERLGQELQRLETQLRGAAETLYYRRIEEAAANSTADHSAEQHVVPLPIRQQLESLQRRVAGRVDDEVERKIAGIVDTLLTLLSRLPQTAAATDPDHYNLQQIAHDYLPGAIERYLALPPELARTEPVNQGMTAHALLAEQLDLLDRSLHSMLTSLYRRDAQGLSIHGRFLRDKFVEHPDDWST